MIDPESRQRTSELPGPRRVAGGEDAIGAALRSLPAETAGPGFTARVLARLGEGGRASRPAILRPAVGWAALAAAALVAAVGIAVMRSPAPPDGPARIAEARPAGASPAPAADPETASAAAADESPPSAAGSAAGDGAPPSAPGAAGNAAGDPATPPAAAGASPGARSGSPRSAPPAASDTRLAATGSPAAAGDAHDALARIRTELDALRREHRRFEIGLADLPEVGRDGQPVVYVGGDEGLGLVLDLGRETAPGRLEDQDSGTSL